MLRRAWMILSRKRGLPLLKNCRHSSRNLMLEKEIKMKTRRTALASLMQRKEMPNLLRVTRENGTFLTVRIPVKNFRGISLLP